MTNVLLSITFACGVVIAGAHVMNARFVAPVYDVVGNLIAFVCASAASSMLHHWLAAAFAAAAVVSWLVLATRTLRALHSGKPMSGQRPAPCEE